VPHAGGARSDAALAGRSQVERSSPTCKSAAMQDALGHESLLEITPWYKADGRNSSTLPEHARLARGGIHGSSQEEVAQSICGSHDSSSLTLL